MIKRKRRVDNFIALQHAEKDMTQELAMLIYYTAIVLIIIAALWLTMSNGVYVMEPAQLYRGF